MTTFLAIIGLVVAALLSAGCLLLLAAMVLDCLDFFRNPLE